MFGDDEQENNGRFDTLRNRMDAEIKRQFPPSNPVKQGTQPSAAQPAATVPTANAPSPGGFKPWVSGVLRHPTGAQIVGTLAAAGLLALIGVIWKVLIG